ncbi:30S ribosomal protein S3 [Chrysiogenes arsenatis]|uniref:30S ribosomal protein S3 n=1 Tax=Chrysiogenes arsenatis TaxID=309797 RepID=UPI000423BA75|nr:30S ribosomal protein S3 [Chrysiogenes arsenatis]
MGQKVNPIGLRLGITRGWDFKWYANKKEYANFLHEDLRIEKFVKKELGHAGISKTEIERAPGKINVTVFTARPGIVIGKKGAEIEKLKKSLASLTTQSVFVNVKEIKKPEVDAQLIAENVAMQLERRIAFRRAMKRAVGMALKFGAEGIKITCAGRLGGAEIARTEWYREGRVPLHTLRADIDYGMAEAKTTYGIIGVKVLVSHGEILNVKKQQPVELVAPQDGEGAEENRRVRKSAN